MEAFSWTDAARAAIASCLPCLSSSRAAKSDDERQQATRRDELESLLQGAEFTDTETDADVLSLHSQIGQQDGRKRVKKKRRKNKGTISLFGFDLFGRPLQAPDDEERNERQRISRISSSTLDSDAAPLADDAIAELSAQTPEQRAAHEARRARKHLRKQKAAALDVQGDTFEGFPGSGALQQQAADDFGAFQQAPSQEQGFVHVQGGGADEGDAEADFDAGSYVRSAPSRSDSGSGTRSRTSGSMSHPHPHLVPLPPSSGSNSPLPSPIPAPKQKQKSSKKPKSGTRSPATLSSTTASQPRSPTSVMPAPLVEIASPQDPAFEGVPQDAHSFVGDLHKRGLKSADTPADGEQERPSATARLAHVRSHRSGSFPTTGFSRSGSGFPSAGLGGRKNSLNIGSRGAFLARTGEDA